MDVAVNVEAIVKKYREMHGPGEAKTIFITKESVATGEWDGTYVTVPYTFGYTMIDIPPTWFLESVEKTFPKETLSEPGSTMYVRHEGMNRWEISADSCEGRPTSFFLDLLDEVSPGLFYCTYVTGATLKGCIKQQRELLLLRKKILDEALALLPED